MNCLAIQEYADAVLQDEFREVHPLCVWGHGEGLIHSRKQVTTMEDLAGMKLRFPSRLNGEALRALGAAPVGMPVPQIPEAMTQGVIDGAVVPWEVVPSIRLQEMAKFHTEIPGSPTLLHRHLHPGDEQGEVRGLAPELRAVLDANSGAAAARMAAVPWDDRGPIVEAEAKKRGNIVTIISEAEKARWVEKTNPVVEAWVAGSKEKGFDGAALLAQRARWWRSTAPASPEWRMIRHRRAALSRGWPPSWRWRAARRCWRPRC
ncbi:hypothetical protein [Dankookia sp. P2]|uniref:hypothetical protein n=1 Tax=Dankookia sp. P2 TaxID=3423955 RepID=UPI003D66C1E4